MRNSAVVNWKDCWIFLLCFSLKHFSIRIKSEIKSLKEWIYLSINQYKPVGIMYKSLTTVDIRTSLSVSSLGLKRGFLIGGSKRFWPPPNISRSNITQPAMSKRCMTIIMEKIQQENRWAEKHYHQMAAMIAVSLLLMRDWLLLSDWFFSWFLILIGWGFLWIPWRQVRSKYLITQPKSLVCHRLVWV